MSSEAPFRADSVSLSSSPDMEEGKSYLVRSRILGKLSACIFLIASLAVVDGLQTLMRQDFNSVSLVPGETTIMSGMMPQNATGTGDLVV